MAGYTENSIVHHGRLDKCVRLISRPFRRERLGVKIAAALGDSRGSDTRIADGSVVPLIPRREA